MSHAIGRSIVGPIKSELAIESPAWISQTEARMHGLANRARALHQWTRLVFLHEHKDRWLALDQVALSIPDHLFPKVLRKVWLDSENIWAERRRISRLIELIRPELLKKLSTAAERRRLELLPDRFTVYRGAKHWNVAGMSWTLDLHRAVYFATHHFHEGAPCLLPPDMVGVVMERTVQKSEVLFYTDDRTEQEVVLRRFVKGPLSPEGTLWVAQDLGPGAFAAELEKQREFLRPEVISGAQNYLALVRATP